MISSALYTAIVKYAESGIQITRIELPEKLFRAFLSETYSILDELDVEVVMGEVAEPQYMYKAKDIK